MFSAAPPTSSGCWKSRTCCKNWKIAEGPANSRALLGSRGRGAALLGGENFFRTRCTEACQKGGKRKRGLEGPFRQKRLTKTSPRPPWPASKEGGLVPYLGVDGGIPPENSTRNGIKILYGWITILSENLPPGASAWGRRTASGVLRRGFRLPSERGKGSRRTGPTPFSRALRWSDLMGIFAKIGTGTKEEQETSEKMEKILISAILATKYDRFLKGRRVR